MEATTPRRRRYTFLHTVNGEIQECDLIEASEDEWDEMPESRCAVWSIFRDHGRI